MPTSQRGPLQDNGGLDDDDDWELSKRLTSSTPDPLFSLNADFDRLYVACNWEGVAKFVTMANILSIHEERLKLQEGLPLQVAIIQSKLEKVAE